MINHYIHVSRSNSKSRSSSQQNRKAHSHSRSRSPTSTKSSKKWINSNAFINFIQDFRQDFTNMKTSRIFKLAGERWRQMSPEEKQPYINAAKSVRSQKQDQQKNDDVNKSNTRTEHKKNENIDNKKNKNTGKQAKISKKPKKSSKEQKRNNKKKYATDSDSDTATSVTSGTITSDNMSDTS
ncbi:uncharacterized protein LOC143344493 [Colletes latitarsis]|uniref:uncharacterized protein LOC143344493 n=1 Tax=Colletes latitarsis TaxID=2605962 RepID=UPI004035D49B